jgi:hypothetical protein
MYLIFMWFGASTLLIAHVGHRRIIQFPSIRPNRALLLSLAEVILRGSFGPKPDDLLMSETRRKLSLAGLNERKYTATAITHDVLPLFPSKSAAIESAILYGGLTQSANRDFRP